MSKAVRLLGGSILAVSILAIGFPLLGDELYVDTSSGISLFDIDAVLGGATSPSGTFGPSGAVTGFSDNQGNVWVVSFASGVSTVQKYDGSGNAIAGAGFQVAAPLQNGVVGPSGNLYFSGASGEIYEYSASTLTQITNWNIATGNPNLSGTQYTAIGIAFDGTNLDTTEGDAGTFIDKWNASGSLQSSVNVGVSSLYGLGQDGGDFFAGTPGDVLEFDATSGAPLNSFAIGASNFSLSAGSAPVAVQPPPPPPPPPPSVPEPGTVPLVLLAGLLMAAVSLLRKRGAWMLLRRISIRRAGWALVILVLPAAYGQIKLNINPSTNTAPIGQTIAVSAFASDPSNRGTFTYQFNVLPPGLSNYSLIRDYSTVDLFPFTTTGREGVYTIQVTALESNGLSTTQTTQLTFTPVATTAPVVSATSHPLVAMYSLPPCPVGSQARVHFRLAGTIFWSYTPYQNCTGNTSLNFLVGGMRANSTYTLQHDIVSNSGDTLGPVMSHTSQAIPQSALDAIPPYCPRPNAPECAGIGQPASGPNATAYPVLLTGVIGNNGIPTGVPGPRTPFAVDMSGQVIWYLPDFTSPLQEQGYMTHPVPGGTFLVIANQTVQADKQLLREYDLAGNILRETNATAIANELAKLGKERITSISHEIFRFPNGDTGFIGSIERRMASAYDSTTNTVHSNVDVLGDMAVVLDTNFHVKWSWDAFDHDKPFSTTTPSGAPLPAFTGSLNEVCAPGAGCPNLININPATGQTYAAANDWLHSNSLAPTPDGNLIISLRHQDMVVKLNYNNGSGDGSMIWRLGPEGDFASSVTAGLTAFEFFNTHQHDAEYEANGVLSLFDNGNSRVSLYGGNSRGQAWQIDDANRTATRAVNVDLGSFALATGSAQRLANNNYHFYLGYIDFSAPNSQSVEVTTSDTDEFKFVLPNALGYRSFRMGSLYSISGQVVYTPFYAVPPGH